GLHHLNYRRWDRDGAIASRAVRTVDSERMLNIAGMGWIYLMLQFDSVAVDGGHGIWRNVPRWLRTLQDGVYGAAQSICCERFSQEVRGACFHRVYREIDRADGGYDDDSGTGIARARLAEHIQALHAGDPRVEEG